MFYNSSCYPCIYLHSLAFSWWYTHFCVNLFSVQSELKSQSWDAFTVFSHLQSSECFSIFIETLSKYPFHHIVGLSTNCCHKLVYLPPSPPSPPPQSPPFLQVNSWSMHWPWSVKQSMSVYLHIKMCVPKWTVAQNIIGYGDLGNELYQKDVIYSYLLIYFTRFACHHVNFIHEKHQNSKTGWLHTVFNKDCILKFIL